MDHVVAAQISSAFQGTAFFLRELNRLSDDALSAPARLRGWTRSMVAADVGYRARALGRLLESASGGLQEPEYPNESYREAEVRYGATLNPRALRYLVEHSAVQLRVLMRDLPDECWSLSVIDVHENRLAVADIPWLRAQNVWGRSVELGSGVEWSDVAPFATEVVV